MHEQPCIDDLLQVNYTPAKNTHNLLGYLTGACIVLTGIVPMLITIPLHEVLGIATVVYYAVVFKTLS